MIRRLPVTALVATLAAPPAVAELRWASVRVDANLEASGTLELTEKHVLVASDGSFVATRRLDARRPAEAEFVEIVFLDPGGEERKLTRGTVGEEDRYDFELARSSLSWTLRPANERPWERPTTLAYRIRWRVRGALTPVWGLRPVPRPMPDSTWSDRIAARWRETREALRRAGLNPFRRYVLDVNLAGPGREGPIEALDYGLTGDDSWTFVGDFMTAKVERAVQAGEGVDVSFLFDWRGGTPPVGVSRVLPALEVAFPLLVLAFTAGWLVENRQARAALRTRNGSSEPVPPEPEALSPEVFASMLDGTRPVAPRASEVWFRLRDGKSIVIDRQGTANLVLRVEPGRLRPPEAALARAVFDERRTLPLVEAREVAAGLGDRLSGLVRDAFDREVRDWLGEAEQAAEAPLFPRGKGHQLDRVVFLLSLFGLLGSGVSVPGKAAVVLATAAVAVGLLLAVRRVRDAGFGFGGALVPVALSLPLTALLLAATYLDPSVPDVAMITLPSALVVVRAGFLGARPRPGRDRSPLRLWALGQREALRERLTRTGGEVDPGEAPWFHAAGLEVSLSEPGVPDDDLEEVLGWSSAGDDEEP
jgi:hypothetical protein